MAVPCWSTPDGSPESIFDVALTSKGLIIRDRKLAHRKEEQAKLPPSEFIFDGEISTGQFEQMARRLYAWSVQQECRHWVRAFDKTELTEKMNYKVHLQTVGGRFYFVEIRNEQF